MHGPHHTLKQTALALALGLSPLASAQAADHDLQREIEALKTRLLQLEAQVQTQQQAQAQAATPTPAAPPAASSGLATQVGKTRFEVGGYIKVDAIMSRFSDGEQTNRTARDIHLPSATPVGAGPASRVFDMHAKTTRFNVKTTTPTESGKDIGGFIEFDFLTGSNGTEVATNRYDATLRHAFLTYDQWLFGQTWTTFQDLGAFPETVEFVGATDGTVFARQPQVRYRHGNVQVALENPESFIRPARAAAGSTPTGAAATDDNDLPDLVGRYTYPAAFGHLSVAAIVRQIKSRQTALASGGTPPAVTARGSDTAYGGGLSVSGRIKVGARDDVRFMLTHGTGIGRYVGLGLIADANLDLNGEAQTNEVTAGYVTYRHFWTDSLRSNFQLAGTQGGYRGLSVGTDTRRNTSGLVNLIYTVTPKFDVGLEYLRSERTLNNGDSGRLDRLQGMAKYAF